MSTERRRKFPWILNPRGKLYTEVQGNSTFGQKMLERMGWKKGKGLGRNEDGGVEHVKVQYKNDSKGIGFTGNDGNWLGNQNDFDNLLADLQNEYKNTASSDNPTSLEVKSKRSKRRVHYHKMIQGKDLSLRSKEDLDCVLGSNHKHLVTPDSQMENVQETTLINEDQMFTSKDSVDSYFEKRRAEATENGQIKEKKRKRKETIDVKHLVEDGKLVGNTNAEPTMAFFGPPFEDACHELGSEERTETEVVKLKKKKKKKLKEKVVNEDASNNFSLEPMLETGASGEDTSAEKSEKRTAETCEEDGALQHRKRKKRKTDANKGYEELKENCSSGSHLEKVGSKKQRRLFRKRKKFKKGNCETENATLTNYHTISVCQEHSNLKDISQQKKKKLELDRDESEENLQPSAKRVRFCEEVTIHTVAKHDEVRGGALRDFLNWDF